MTITLRIILILASTISSIMCIKKIKQAKLKIENAIIWIMGSLLLILMSVFSSIVDNISSKLGFVAPVNFVFLIIIAFLLIEVYLNNIRISELNEKIKNLTHHIALEENKNKRIEGKK